MSPANELYLLALYIWAGIPVQQHYPFLPARREKERQSRGEEMKDRQEYVKNAVEIGDIVE